MKVEVKGTMVVTTDYTKGFMNLLMDCDKKKSIIDTIQEEVSTAINQPIVAAIVTDKDGDKQIEVSLVAQSVELNLSRPVLLAKTIAKIVQHVIDNITYRAELSILAKQYLSLTDQLENGGMEQSDEAESAE